MSAEKCPKGLKRQFYVLSELMFKDVFIIYIVDKTFNKWITLTKAQNKYICRLKKNNMICKL